MKSLTTYTHELREFVAGLNLPDTSAISHYPRLSIITPSFNQASFLERTILSVLNQGYPNLEYIIIDGGSTDHSVEIIRKYEKYITYWVSEQDNGQVDALNKGFKIATGEWIGFQNSDDVYFPGTLQKLGEALTKNPESDMVFGDLFIINEDDLVTEFLKTIPYQVSSQLVEGMQIHNQSLFFKKALIDRYGPFDPQYHFAFDYEFIIRYTYDRTTRVNKIAGLAGALRVHQDAKSSTIASLGRKEHQEIRDSYFAAKSYLLPNKLQYFYFRFRRLVLLISQGDWGYITHRYLIKHK